MLHRRPAGGVLTALQARHRPGQPAPAGTPPGARSARQSVSGSPFSAILRSRRKIVMELCVGSTTARSVPHSLMRRVRRLWRWPP
jgi:hypothetical protein